MSGTEVLEMTKKTIIQAPCIDQTADWPTGCESVSTVMLLQYLGIHISVDDFIKKYLPCRPFEQREGKVIGADPRQEFAGSPYDPESMGCYAPVIRRALQSVLTDWTERAGESAWHIEDLTGVPMDRICTEYLDRGRPVIFWACIDMKEPIAGPDWYLEDGGTVFSWVSNEHCMLLVGYDEDMYYFNDPWEHHGTIGYPREVVEARHQAQYEMAVTAYRISGTA